MIFLAVLSAFLLIVVVTLIAGSGWTRFVKHPEESSTHAHEDDRGDTTSDRFYATSDRPAGPDAEDPPAP